MGIITINANPLFNFNHVRSLSDVKYYVAPCIFKKDLPWKTVVTTLSTCFNKQESNEKDAAGFNLNILQALTRQQINSAILDKLKNKPNRTMSIESKRNEFLDRIMPKDDKTSISLRRKQYLLNCTALFLDYDNDSSSNKHKYPLEVTSILDELGISYVAYSSFSSTPYRPKYRVVIPYSRPVNLVTHTVIFEFFVYILNRDYTDITDYRLDITSELPIRFFYIPNNKIGCQKAPENTIHTNSAWFKAIDNSMFLDVDMLLKYVKINRQTTNTLKGMYQIKHLIKKDKANA
jgi:hypothetical protein